MEGGLVMKDESASGSGDQVHQAVDRRRPELDLRLSKRVAPW
jgi:hypothetical protein